MTDAGLQVVTSPYYVCAATFFCYVQLTTFVTQLLRRVTRSLTHEVCANPHEYWLKRKFLLDNKWRGC